MRRFAAVFAAGMMLAPAGFAAPGVTALDQGLVSPTGLRQFVLQADGDGFGDPLVFTFGADANAHHVWADAAGPPTRFSSDVTGAYFTGPDGRAAWDTHVLFAGSLSDLLFIDELLPVTSETISTPHTPAGLPIGDGQAGTGAYTIEGMALVSPTPTTNFFQVVARPGQSVNIAGFFIPEGSETPVDFDVTVNGYLLGDANADGQVSLADLSLLGNNFNQAGSWSQGDFNGDGQVSLADLSILGANFNQTESAVSPTISFEEALMTAGLTSLVPEPTSLTLLGLGSLAIVCRRRAQKVH